METCIIIPSHINNFNRTKLLVSCLHSLINQIMTIPIYLSISFETELDKRLFNKLIEKNNLLNCILLCIIYKDKKTKQFRHIEQMITFIKDKYKYVMFCDDDDTYDLSRVEKFRIMIQYGFMNIQKDKIFVGVYERELQKSHKIKFYEYWSYCVNIKFIINFINILKNNNYDYVFDNIMCDVLFSSYLRHLDNNHVFVSINEKLYNYNKHKNSITGRIISSNIFINNTLDNFELNEEFMNSIKNNIFIFYSMLKMPFEEILQKYQYKIKINKYIIKKLKFEYDNIKSLCDILYQYK